MSSQVDIIRARLAFELLEVEEEIAAEIKANVEEEMPVDTGWARSNVGVVIDRDMALDGSVGLAVTNAADYVEQLNEGSSPQAEAGFHERAIQDAFDTVEARLAVREVEL